MLTVRGSFESVFTVAPSHGAVEYQWGQLSKTLETANRTGHVAAYGRTREGGPYYFTVSDLLINELNLRRSSSPSSSIVRDWLEKQMLS